MDNEGYTNQYPDSIEQQQHNASVAKKKPIHKTYKIVKTVVLMNAWICLGLWTSVITPCIDVLKNQIGCNYEELSRALASKSVGIMIGSVVLGYVADKFQKRTDLLLCFEVLGAGLALSAIPWTTNLPMMATAFALVGICHGGLSAGGNAHAILLWGADATRPVHLIHFGYGVGTILGPVLMAPFLPSSKQNETHHNTSDSHHYQLMSPLQSETTFYYYSQGYATQQNTSANLTSVSIKIPFAITGGFSIVIATFFFLFMFFPYYYSTQQNTNTSLNDEQDVKHQITQKKTSNFKDILSPGSCAGGDVAYGLQMFLLIFVYYVVLVGKDTSVVTFLQPVAVNSPNLDFTLKEADLFITVFFICYASGRLIIAILGKCLPIQVLVFVEMIGTTIAQILLILFALKSNLAFWLTNCLFSIFIGPMFPSGMAWSDRYIKMTALAFAILDVGIGLGSFAFSWLCGYLLNSYPHKILYYLSLGCGLAQFLILILMQIRGSLKGDRYKLMTASDSQSSQVDNVAVIQDDSDTVGLIQ